MDFAAHVLMRSRRLVPEGIHARRFAMARLVEPPIPLDARAVAGSDRLVGGGIDDASRGVLLLGDSLLVSAGVRRLEDTLGARLGVLLEKGAPTAGGTRVTSYAVSGTTSRTIGPQLRRAAAHDGPVDHVLFSVGGNDVTAFTPLRRYATGFGDALDAARAAHPQAQLWVVGVPRMDNATVIGPTLRTTLEARARAVRDVQRLQAQAHGARVLSTTDLYDGVAPAAHVAADGFHPSAAGYDHAARHLLARGLARTAPRPHP